MLSIKRKMFLSFGLTALVSIILIGTGVSWRMNRSILEQTEALVASMTENMNESLRFPHQTANAWMRKSIRRSVKDLRNNPELIEDLELQNPLALTASLETAAITEGVDMALLFNAKGQLQASFPSRLNEFEIYDYLETCELWRHTQRTLQGELSENTMSWDTLALFDAKALQTFRLGTDTGTDESALMLLSAVIIENDFGDPVGIGLIGEVLNNRHELLQQLTEVTGFAGAIYLNQLPIAQAGFGSDETPEADPKALKISAEMQTEVYKSGDADGLEFHLMLAETPYLTICSSLTSFSGDNLGILCTGIPELRIRELQQQMVAQGMKTKKVLQQSVLRSGLLSFVLFAVVSLALAANTVKPLKKLSKIAKQIALGDIRQEIDVHSRDEIGELAHSLRAMVESFQEISDSSQAIAQGKLDHPITPRSDQDVLGQALQQMSEYLSETASVAAAIAEGDLTAKTSVRTETDVFGHAMSLMLQGLRSLIHQISASAEKIAAIGVQINSLSEQDTQLAQEVQTSTEDMTSTMTEMSSSVGQVAQNMDSLLAFVQQTSSSITEITTSVASVASNTLELAGQTQQMGDVVGESVQTIQTITQQTDMSQKLSQATERDALEGQQAVEQIRESMDSIQQTNRHAVETVNRFAQQSGEIGTVLDVIQAINDQSSLLALNASIIAAQAGSHGRGFSVIAEEMRNLSNEVGASTKSIAELIQSIAQETDALVAMIESGTTEIDQGVDRTQQAEQRLQKILSSAKQSSKVTHDIAEALHTQVETNHGVIKAIEHVSSMTSEITRATGEQNTNILQVGEVIDNILDMASQTQQASEEQLHGVRQVLETTRNIGALTEQNFESSQQINHTVMAELAPQAQNLLHAVERFKLSEEEERHRSESLT